MSKRARYTLNWMVVISFGLAVLAGAIHNAYNPGGLKFAEETGHSRIETVHAVSRPDSSDSRNEP
jgi:hypothetical protein